MNHQLSIANHQKAAFDASYYTLSQLKAFYARASVGFVCAAIASWALSAFFIAQFLAGADFEYMNEWRLMQYVYALIGILLASALTFAEVILFNSGKAREALILTIVSVSFSVFCETAAAMQREQTAVKFKSQQSEVFKATLNAANQMAGNIGLSATQIQLVNAQQALADARRDNNQRLIATAQRRIERLEQTIEMERANNTALLSTTLNKAKELEYDEENHQAIIKLMAELFGLSHVVSSSLLALFLIVTFKLSFHYLGNTKQRSERAISIAQGDLSAQLSPALLRANSLHVQLEQQSAKMLENQRYPAETTEHVQSDDADALYSQFVTDLRAGGVGTAQRDLKDWVKRNLNKSVALYEIQDIADGLLNKALTDKYIANNPEYREGNRKPKYLIN